MKTLRDEFAMAAANGMMSDPKCIEEMVKWETAARSVEDAGVIPEFESMSGFAFTMMASWAYQAAGAMMEERKQHLPTYITDRENNTP